MSTFLKRSHASSFLWTWEIQAKSEEWTTQTMINSDTFWPQSFGTHNSYLIGKYKIYVILPVITLFFLVYKGNFQVQAPRGLYSEGRFNGGSLSYDFGGGEGLYLEGLIFGILRFY